MFFTRGRQNNSKRHTHTHEKPPCRSKCCRSHIPILYPVSAFGPSAVSVLLAAYPKARCTHFPGSCCDREKGRDAHCLHAPPLSPKTRDAYRKSERGRDWRLQKNLQAASIPPLFLVIFGNPYHTCPAYDAFDSAIACHKCCCCYCCCLHIKNHHGLSTQYPLVFVLI